MKVSSLIEFIDAGVDSKYIYGGFEERGGIMLVAYPGMLKSTIIRASLQHHNSAIVNSDMNVHQWIKLREDFVTGRYNAIGFTDYEKIYQRHPSTSKHVEGIIAGLVAEGYGISPTSDQRMPYVPARAFVAGAITSTCFERHYSDWTETGFLRRFLWMVYTVSNPDAIMEAIRRWQKLNFGRVSFRPANGEIPMEVDDQRSRLLENMMKSQPGANGTAYVLLKKICAVLDWKYSPGSGKERTNEILRDIAPALSKNGGKLEL